LSLQPRLQVLDLIAQIHQSPGYLTGKPRKRLATMKRYTWDSDKFGRGRKVSIETLLCRVYREQWTPEQVITVLRYVEKRQHAYLHDFWDSVADNGFVHWYPHNRYRLFRERLFELPWLLSMRGFHESNFCRVTVEAFWDEKNWGASIP